VNVSHKQIAKVTGFSRATVSRALSNQPSISEPTKVKVRQAAAKLGYRPNALMSILTSQIRKSRTSPTNPTLAYVTSFPEPQIIGTGSPHYCEFHIGAKERAETLGYQLDVIWRRENSMTAARFNQILRTRGIRGVIIAPRPHPLGHITMDYSNIAAVAVGHPLPAPHISHTSAWHFQLVSLAMRQIAKLGYQRPGFAVFGDADRYASFSYSARFALHQMQIPVKNRVPMLMSPTSTGTPGRKEFETWYFQYKPDVLLITHPVVREWIVEMGLQVPEELGYADLGMSEENSGVSGVYDQCRKVGAAAVDLVVEQINLNEFGVPETPKCIFIEGKWIQGTTLRELRAR